MLAQIRCLFFSDFSIFKSKKQKKLGGRWRRCCWKDVSLEGWWAPVYSHWSTFQLCSKRTTSIPKSWANISTWNSSTRPGKRITIDWGYLSSTISRLHPALTIFIMRSTFTVVTIKKSLDESIVKLVMFACVFWRYEVPIAKIHMLTLPVHLGIGDEKGNQSN